MKGKVTKTGYKKNSPDVNNDYNIIPSGRITMRDVQFPVYGVDEYGNAQIMYPGGEYQFPGNAVFELPMAQLGGMRRGKVDRILNQNRDLNFVQRMYQPGTPSIMIPGQDGPSTHFMESADGFVYPTVVQMPDGNLQYLGEGAYDHAMQTGEYIQFPNDRQARRFAKSYKKGTGVLKEYQTAGETSTEENPERMEEITITPKTWWEQRMRRSDSPRAPRKPERNYQDNLRTTSQPTYQAIEQSNANRKRQREIQQEIDTQIYNDPDRSKLSNEELFLDRFSSPFSYIDYKTSGRPLDDYTKLERTSILDYPLDFRNPVPILNAAYNTMGSLKEGNYLDAFFNSLDAVPGIIGGARALSKSTSPLLSKSGLLGLKPKPWQSAEADNAIKYMKDWVGHPDYVSRINADYDMSPEMTQLRTNLGLNPNPGLAKQAEHLNYLENYTPKSYADLLYDLRQEHGYLKGTGKYLNYGIGTNGVSTPNGSYINASSILGPTKNTESILVHELTHDLQRLDNSKNLGHHTNKAVPHIYNRDIDSTPDWDSPIKQSYKEYMTMPEEVHARMMEGRHNFGLTPSDVFTSEMYDQALQKNNWYGMGSYIKDKDKFINLMNTMRAIPAIGAAGYGASQITQQKLGGRLQQAYMKSGGQHGGLDRWFAEKWVDVKTGKECGRSGKDKNSRPYPACRPSKRVNETTPKTTSEMSSSEKAKFKREKTSGKRINYNHKRAQDGTQVEPTSWTDYLNPMNWGVSTYDDAGTFNQAFAKARQDGQDEFMWYGNRYNTELAPQSDVTSVPVKKQTPPDQIDLDFDTLKRGVSFVESRNGKYMWNPESSATGLYGQRFSEIKDTDIYSGTRENFRDDVDAQNRVFQLRYEGQLPGSNTGLKKDAIDLYREYYPIVKKNNISPVEIAALSNFLGRQGTRYYLGYVLRDGRSLESVFPNLYGSGAEQSNKTPEQYLQLFREAAYAEQEVGGEIEKHPDYSDHASYVNAWKAARRQLGAGKKFKYGGRVMSTSTPNGH